MLLLSACSSVTDPAAPPAGDGDQDGDGRDEDGSSEEQTPGDGADLDAGTDEATPDAGEDSGDAALPPEPPVTSVPSQGSAEALDIGSWNIEWFGDLEEGPSNNERQAENAREVLLGSAMDLWGLAEIVDPTAFAALVSDMPGYRAVLASDANVTGGSQSYAYWEQKVGLLYREDIATVKSAAVVLRDEDYAFAGRPPLEVKLDVRVGGRTRPLVVLVLHAKALDDDDSWDRRSQASSALKRYLDDTYPNDSVIVVGDFNDTLDGSIAQGRDSPYAAFVSDASAYFFASSELDGGTTVGRDTAIDHHLLTDEMRAFYVPDSAFAYRVDRYIPNFQTTTSDHYPVISRYDW